jgi:hypothetical protein
LCTQSAEATKLDRFAGCGEILHNSQKTANVNKLRSGKFKKERTYGHELNSSKQCHCKSHGCTVRESRQFDQNCIGGALRKYA